MRTKQNIVWETSGHIPRRTEIKDSSSRIVVKRYSGLCSLFVTIIGRSTRTHYPLLLFCVAKDM